MWRKIAALSGILVASQAAIAPADWMFRRSYSSHVPIGAEADDEPQSRAAYRLAVPQRGPGYSIRSSSRTNVYRLHIGQSWDTTINRAYSFEITP